MAVAPGVLIHLLLKLPSLSDGSGPRCPNSPPAEAKPPSLSDGSGQPPERQLSVLQGVRVPVGGQAPVQQRVLQAVVAAAPEVEPAAQDLAELGVEQAVEEGVDGGVGQQHPEGNVPQPSANGSGVPGAQHGDDGAGQPAQREDRHQQAQESRRLLVLSHQQLLHQVRALGYNSTERR